MEDVPLFLRNHEHTRTASAAFTAAEKSREQSLILWQRSQTLSSEPPAVKRVKTRDLCWMQDRR